MLYRELSDLAFQGRIHRFVLGHHRCLGLLAAVLAAVKLRQPHLDEAG